MGTVTRIYDVDGKPVSDGATGRIFVGNSQQFEGYTGGGDKERIEALMSIGDVGYFDENGLLFVEGRAVPQAPVLEELVPVIRRHDDEGLLAQLELVDAAARRLATILAPLERERVVTELIGLAYADGGVDVGETDFVLAVARALDVEVALDSNA